VKQLLLGVISWLLGRAGQKDLDIRSTRVKRCPSCSVRITPANDSGWEYFVTATYTQPTCKDCDAKQQAGLRQPGTLKQ